MNEKKFNLLKKVNGLLNIVIGSLIGVFLGHTIYIYWDYQKRPGLYAIQSAPWYTSILVYGLSAAVIILIAIVIKCVIKKKRKNDE